MLGVSEGATCWPEGGRVYRARERYLRNRTDLILNWQSGRSNGRSFAINLGANQMWITGRQIGNAWRQTRGFLKTLHHEGKKSANMIDGYASLFRKGLSAAAPMLQDLCAGGALGSGVKALQSYGTVRKQVMDVDERGRGHYGRIAKAIA